MRSLALLVVLAICHPLVGFAQPAPLREVARREVQRRVAAQVLTELSLYSAGVPDALDPGQVKVEVVDDVGGALIVVARPQSIFHWQGYSLLVSPAEVAGLSGFKHPKFASSADLLATLGTLRTASALAAALVASAEAPFGAPELILEPARDTVSPGPLGRLWARTLPPGWPASGEQPLSDGRVLVRLTALRPTVAVVGQSATPIAYAFLFSREGALESVAIREGEAF